MNLEPWYWTQQALNALVVSSFYALFAVAYVLVLGVTNRLNLAFGAMATWAGYTAIAGIDLALTTTFLSHATILVLALFAVIAMAVGFGVVFGRSVLPRFLGETLLSAFVATFGMALALEEAIRIVASSRDMWLEPILTAPLLALDFGEHRVLIPQGQALVTIAAYLTAIGLALALGRSRFGRAWRAVAQDPGMARLLGVDPARIVLVSALLSCLASAQAGAGYAIYYGNISPYSGFAMGLKALFIAIIGGARSLRGAIFGSLAVGMFETLWSAAMPIDLRDAATYSVLITALIVLAPGQPDINTREVG